MPAVGRLWPSDDDDNDDDDDDDDDDDVGEHENDGNNGVCFLLYLDLCTGFTIILSAKSSFHHYCLYLTQQIIPFSQIDILPSTTKLKSPSWPLIEMQDKLLFSN